MGWLWECVCGVVFLFKQKTAYEMRISDWSSDVCSSDLEKAADQSRVDDRAGAGELRRVPDPLPHLGAADLGRRRVLHEVVDRHAADEIGRASCRERVCEYV